MGFKVTTKSETIIYKGIKFRRYPNSKQGAHRNYYRPHCGHVKNGVQHLHQEIWKDANGKIPKGFSIHHKDGNFLNNKLSNLEAICRRKHTSMHMLELWKEKPETLKKHLDKARIAASKWHKSEEARPFHIKLGKESWKSARYRVLKCVVCKNKFKTRARSNKPKFCGGTCKARALRIRRGAVSRPDLWKK